MIRYLYLLLLISILGGCESSSNKEFIRFEDKLRISEIVLTKEQQLRDSLQLACEIKMDSIAKQTAQPQIELLKKRKSLQ